MKKLYAILLMLLVGSSVAMAGDWKRQYGTDEFGDIDRSMAGWGVLFNPQGGYGASVYIVFVNGNFGVQFTDAYESLEHTRGMKIKAPSGNVYDIGYQELDDGLLRIDEDYVPMFLALLNQGNFTFSVKTVKPFSENLSNHIFKVGRQTTGIQDLVEADGWFFPPMHSDL